MFNLLVVACLQSICIEIDSGSIHTNQECKDALKEVGKVDTYDWYVKAECVDNE